MTKKQIEKLALQAREASYQVKALETVQKNKVLRDLAKALLKNKAAIQKANLKDVRAAQKKGLSAALIDRLVLNEKRICDMHDAVLEIVALPDPVGEVTESRQRAGLKIKKMRIPLGVICMIYESRPNVTIDAASLCFKSGNAVILRGGSEAFHSNTVLVDLITSCLKKHKLDPHIVTMVPDTSRSAMVELLQLDKCIDVVIPRGGEGLMKFISEHTRVPVIKHDKGICSAFIDESADLKKALKIVENAKVQRPGVCNALENLYVHQKIAKTFLPKLYDLLSEQGVELRGDKQARQIVPKMRVAKDIDFHTEYLDLILAVKIVKDVQDAIQNVIKTSSLHTECIVTENRKHQDLYVKSLTSSCIMINTSTRFNDGGQLGLGAEIGISTSKLHAYGPMGLRELTTQNFVVESRHKIRK